ncbi:hypothetical protein E1B28_009409 [Marasmius oreades]|uniref:Uncharacterized protein n=1 Tax=Marasmius oreades TaxID=181124 RepID=A0A9P7UVA6_9AGAR|nr:uncharacterized protein E1B28_009409 [Marasmius oreades]KAG7093124.1 hypothetical protein E1B28_009409 [Marasmius oreades]
MESAALQTLVEVLFLIFRFVKHPPIQYMFYCLTVPFVGITFSLITLRIKTVGSILVKEEAPVLSFLAVNLEDSKVVNQNENSDAVRSVRRETTREGTDVEASGSQVDNGRKSNTITEVRLETS